MWHTVACVPIVFVYSIRVKQITDMKATAPTTKIKKVASVIFDCSPILTTFQADDFSEKVESAIGDLIPEWFSESYPSRPKYTKGATICEYFMKGMEDAGSAIRIAPRTWRKIS